MMTCLSGHHKDSMQLASRNSRQVEFPGKAVPVRKALSHLSSQGRCQGQPASHWELK